MVEKLAVASCNFLSSGLTLKVLALPFMSDGSLLRIFLCIERHGNITLETDIMYINGIPFVMTSKGIHFCTAKLIKN